MAVNKRRGFRRLIIVTLMLWIAFWGASYMAHERTAAEYLKDHQSHMKAILGGFAGPTTVPDARMAIEASDRAKAQATQALAIGIGVPIISIVLLALGWWIYRGFKSEEAAHDQ